MNRAQNAPIISFPLEFDVPPVLLPIADSCKFLSRGWTIQPAIKQYWLTRFRAIHLEFADRYIHRQAKSDANNPHDVGTGGTPFMPYLEKHRLGTTKHRVG